VNLGIVPGAGGTQRLPRLIGVRAALDLMLTGKQLDGRRARSAGIVDEVVPAAILPVVARQVANDLAEGDKEPRGAARRSSPQWMENLPGMRQLIFSKARQGVMAKTKGLYPGAAPPPGGGREGAGPRHHRRASSWRRARSASWR
jgi:3-hydroxyacyl-CoA dehydrogenase/enoyl-CoA hydratase/3-hydroxybutyryl-CoA epimerase